MQDASAVAIHTQNYIEIRKSEARLQSRYGNGITCKTTTERTTTTLDVDPGGPASLGTTINLQR